MPSVVSCAKSLCGISFGVEDGYAFRSRTSAERGDMMMANTSESSRSTFRVHGVRYQSRNVSRAVAFYTTELGFELKHQQGEAFAAVSCGDTDLLLSGAESSGAQPLPDGQQQQPGGWNRLVLAVSDLAATVASLKSRGVA